MANANAPFGLRPVGKLSGAPFAGAVRAFSVAAGDGTAIYIGDPVKGAGTSQFINGQTYSDVVQAATGDVLTGVVVGVEPVTSTSTIYRVASTQRIVYVNVDPDALFEIQQGTGGTALNANDIGLNANFAVSAGSATTGLSGVTLNNVGEATTNTLDLKIIGIVNRADNDPGSAVTTGGDASRFLVRINRHQYADQVAGI
jgi:hypothetical protein